MPKVGGLYQGLLYKMVNLEDLTPSEIERNVDEWFNAAVGAHMEDSIASIVYVPTDLFLATSDGEAYTFNFYENTPGYSWLEQPHNVDGYIPKNNKLFTYPYMSLGVDTLSAMKTFRYEWFTGNIGFQLRSSINAHPEIALAPVNYDGLVVGQNDNTSEELVISDFPQCAFTMDTYRAWVAQKQSVYTAGMIGTVGGGLVGAAANLAAGNIGGVFSSIINSGTSAMQQAAQAYVEQNKGNTVRGNQGGSINAATGKTDFYFKKFCITYEYARTIDDFFNRFGYSCRRLKVPNRAVRPHWTYTKTAECTIRGAVPTDAMSKINSIYNKGITFWRNASEVGNYSLNNSPV